jgi:protein phosphatase 1L
MTRRALQTAEGPKLLASNVGDARVLLARAGKAEQLTVDHVPDDEDERARIEAQNPNPRLPLVRYVGETWRVGGLLALSRAFGNAYMKGSLQFEGISSGSDDYSAGFGVIAEPSQMLVDLCDQCTWVRVAAWWCCQCRCNFPHA